MWAEFRDFINRGNVMDLAVAVIIGAAFGAIVTSLVDNIITPLIGLVMGGVDFSGLSVGIGNAQILYGNFIQAVIDFLIIAFVVFLIVRTLNNMQRRLMGDSAEENPPEEPEYTVDQQMLMEIRDLLQKRAI